MRVVPSLFKKKIFHVAKIIRIFLNRKRSEVPLVYVEPFVCWGLVLARTVYVNGQNNVRFTGSLDNFRWFGLHTMSLQSKPRQVWKDFKSFNKQCVKSGQEHRY